MSTESREQRLSYWQKSDVKVIRRKHRIGFTTTCTVAELIVKLQKVPSLATVDEIDVGDDDIITIEFHEEVVEK